MWQEDLTEAIGQALQRPDVVLVAAPARAGGDWATVILPPDPPDDAAAAVQYLPGVQAARWSGRRLAVTLTDAARGQVVTDLLTGNRPTGLAPAHRAAPAPGHLVTLKRAGGGAPLPHLYPVRLAHARTAMLLRQGRDHEVLTADTRDHHGLARHWRDRACGGLAAAPGTEAGDPDTCDGAQQAPAGDQETATQQLLVSLATSNLARQRAAAQGRAAPVVTNLGRLATHFTQWFARTRCTPRGSPPAPDAAIMETYRHRLALAAATGLALRAGLTDLGIDAPEYL